MKKSTFAWNDDDEGNGETFFRYVKALSDETLTTLKITSLVAYPIHVV